MRFMPSFIKFREKAEHATMSLPGLITHAEKLADTILHGEHSRRKSGAGEKFWQYREYVPGDRPQDIDWRQSAKTDHIFVKQKEWQITRKTYFWCNKSSSMDFKSSTAHFSKQNYAQIMTLALAILLQKNKEQIGIYGQARSGRSEKMIETIGHDLFEMNKDALPNSKIATLPKDAYFIGIGDFLSPIEDINKSFAHLSERTENGFILQILDPAELDLPYTGRVQFYDSSQANKHLINHVPTIRAKYQERIKHQCDMVKIQSINNGWTHYLCTTDTPPNTALNEIYMLLENRGQQ